MEDFNIVISNPPYGKIGTKITRSIIKDIDYDEFVNLLPHNDYYMRDEYLYKYTDKNITTVRGFEDAAVTTHLMKVNRDIDFDYSLDDFIVNKYKGTPAEKYVRNNLLNKRYIRSVRGAFYQEEQIKKYDPEVHVCILYRAMMHCYLTYSEESFEYRFNKYNDTSNFARLFSLYNMRTKEEKRNWVNFMYSDEGRKFTKAVWTAISTDTEEYYGFPQLDWTKSWTLEEVLDYYEYTDEEKLKFFA